ncbi:MAG: PQQ-binding-like beta-propeller repeat protein, partial [Ferruginibacter sp.]
MKKTFLFFISLAAGLSLFAQKNADWTKEFPSKINWYRITDAGTVMVATKDALYGISPNGEEAWKADDIENIKEENLDVHDGTPYVTLVKAKLIKSNNKVVDVVSGKTILNTEDLGFHNVLKRLYLPQSNQMLFYGGNKNGKLILVLADLGTGSKVWEQEKVFEKKSEQLVSKAREVNGGILIATDKNIYNLNKTTGEVLYSIDMKSDLPVQKQVKKSGFGGFGKAFGGSGASEMQTMTSADFFQGADKSKFYFWNQDYITQFDAATGNETWTRFKLPSPIAYILQDSRGMIIATAEKRQEDIAKANSGGGGLIGKIKKSNAAGKNRATLILLDPATGNTKWNSEDVDLKGDILAYKLAGNKLILGTELDKGDNFISIVDLDAGKSITKKPISIKGDVTDLQLVPQGLYFRTTEQINILDMETGDKTWKKGFKVKNCLGYNVDENTGYVYGNGKVYKVDFKTGDMDEWLQSLNFNRDEEHNTMGIYDNKIFISSDQNASLYDSDAKLVYHTYV